MRKSICGLCACLAAAMALLLSPSDVFCAETLPARYDLRDLGKAPSVKDQGAHPTCWSLVAVSALESALLPGEDIALSADHMTLRNGFSIDPDDGGDYRMIMAYLSSWTGPVLLSDDPYGDGVSPEGLSAALHVQEIRMLPEQDEAVVRQMILEHGAMQTSLYMDHDSVLPEAGCYNAEHAAYYCAEKKKNDHDVLVIGWDDDFPKEYFADPPSRDGAYICQNSWGEDFGEDGVFYVSYEDANICGRGLVFPDVDAQMRYDGIYQADTCGWQGQQGYGDEGCFFANVYTARRDERLAAAGFYATGPDTSYELFLVHDFEEPGDFESKERIGSGVLKEAGYYTVPIEDAPLLREGERFALVCFIGTPGAKNPAAVEFKKDRFTQDVTLDGREGYLSFAGTVWENTEEKYETNVCLKAYTQKVTDPSAEEEEPGSEEEK